MARPEKPKPPAAEEPRSESAELARALCSRACPKIPRSTAREQAAERLLANLLDWHWRESKQTWWEYFRALELPPAERLEDRAVLAELTFVSVVGTEKKSSVCRYEFPEQEHSIKLGSNAHDPDTDKGAGEVLALGDDFVHLKRGPSMTGHPRALIAGGPLNTKAHAARLLALAARCRAVLRTGTTRSARLASCWFAIRRAAGKPPEFRLVERGRRHACCAIQRLALALGSLGARRAGPARFGQDLSRGGDDRRPGARRQARRRDLQ